MNVFLRGIMFFLLLTPVKWVSGQSGIISPSRNDHIFPSAPKAKRFINYDSRGFLINGKRTFIISAGIEYTRIPRGLWHDCLLRLKRAGFNTVEFYTFWNFHEPKEGQFNFKGDHDLNVFLRLVKNMGMYAIARVGPYYCGEWSMGGYPVWLKFKPGLRVREDNPQFLYAVDKFFDKLIPIITRNQINYGGAVIMVQLENEHNASWGTVIPNGYFRHLINKTVSLGLQVPYFFSGLHPGNDPASNRSNLDDALRPNPWFSTEYWGVWFLNYGPQPQDSAIYDRRTWKIIAHGGNGYNVYMAHGGTNFDYNNDRDMAASYDYGAAVGQAGDLRPIYYSFKRAAWFARSFQNILENSVNDPENKPIISDTAIKVTVRKSPAGRFVFLDNPDTTAVQFKLNIPPNSNIQSPAQIKLEAGEIMPVVQNYQLNSQVKLLWAPTRIYRIVPQGNTTTLLIYGPAGSAAQLYFRVPKKVTVIQGISNFKVSDTLMSFNARIAFAAPSEYRFKVGNKQIRIIAVNNILASKSWFTVTGNQNDIIIGPAYMSNLISKNNRLTLVTERPWEDNSNTPIWIFKQTGAPIILNPKFPVIKRLALLKLNTWQTKNASEAALPDYNDTRWKLSANPLQMGADGDISADSWYRAKIKVAETDNYILQFKSVRDRAALFLDGKRIDTGTVFNKTVTLHLTGGINHTLAVFTAHDGRNKLIFRTGEIDTLDTKGLTGAVTLKRINATEVIINNWRMKGGPGNPFTATGWESMTGKSLNSPQFYRTVFNLPALKGPHPIWRVNTTSLSYGSVWVNGHNLGRYPEKIKINGLYIPECWLKSGRNTLVIYDENGLLPINVSIEAEMAASRDTYRFKTKLLQ
jgi:beta-galactosidase